MHSLQKPNITLSPPLTAPHPIPLQLLLRVHQPRLHPHAIAAIIPHTLAIQQIRQRAFDLLIHILQFPLLFLDLSKDALVDNGW